MPDFFLLARILSAPVILTVTLPVFCARAARHLRSAGDCPQFPKRLFISLQKRFDWLIRTKTAAATVIPMRPSVLPFLSLFLFLAGCLAGPQSMAQSTNPLEGSSRATYAGGALFRAQCATCHGADATGIDSIDAPDLTSMWQQRGYNDAEVFAIIRRGIPGTIMPPHEFTETEIWMLVNYLRSVGSRGVTSLPSGDPDRGGSLFAQHCAECHRVGSSGGILGPDLSDLLQRSDLQAIRVAIREPDALVPAGYKTVQVVSHGESVEGVLKNEDAFSLQLLSREQELRAFPKREVRLQRRAQSLMPAFGSAQLSEQDLADILNFIRSREGSREESRL